VRILHSQSAPCGVLIIIYENHGFVLFENIAYLIQPCILYLLKPYAATYFIPAFSGDFFHPKCGFGSALSKCKL